MEHLRVGPSSESPVSEHHARSSSEHSSGGGSGLSISKGRQKMWQFQGKMAARNFTQIPPRIRTQRTPKPGGGGAQKRGGGGNLTSRPPNFPRLISSQTAFGGSRKMVSDGPSSRGSAFGTFYQGKKEYTPPPWHPSFFGLSPNPEVTAKAMVYTILLGKQWEKCVHHRSAKRVYTIEAADPGKEKRSVSTVVVYIFSSLL